MARAVTSNDLMTLTTVSDVQVSQNGRSAAWVQTSVVPAKPGDEQAAPRYRGRIHLTTDLHKKGGAEFTHGEHNDNAPRFSPSGEQLAFLRVSAPKAKPQLHVMPLGGGEAERLTDHPAGVRGHVWAPGGDQIAYITLGDYEDATAKSGLPRRIVRRYWRADGAGVLPTAAAQIHVYDLKQRASRQLTRLPESAETMAFAPDGRSLWVVVRSGERPRGDNYYDLLRVDVASGAHEVVLSETGGMGNLAPSPDGRWLAFAGQQVQGDVASPPGVWLLDLASAGAEPRLLSGAHESPPSAGGDSRYGAYSSTPAWSAGSDALLVNVNAAGASFIARLDLEGHLTPLQSGRRVVTAFAAPGAGAGVAALFVAEHTDRPGEVHALWPDGSENQVSRANDAWRRRLELRAAEGPFPAGENDIPYWLLRPSTPRPDGAAVVQVHGGPHTNYGYGFNFEFQLLAAKGYAVVFGNPRGSSSYGYTFATGFLGAYGSLDADDVMAIAEAGHARLGKAGAPLHLTGGSYGGFMTNWLLGQTTRFRSAVTQRSICNWTSMYGTSDIGPWFVEREIGGVPWGDAEALWRQSPIRFADRIETPLLIVHSEEDYRCPIEQAEQLFSVLKRLGKAETEFLRVPGEGHELSRSGRPDRRVARLDAIVGWFERHA